MALCLYDGGAEMNRKHFQNDLDNPKDIESESFEEIKLSKKKQENYKKKECRVISYNPHTKNLDIKFDKYGIRLTNIKNFIGEIVEVEYRGEIGQPNFEIKYRC
jgi:hypothetical protein